MGIRYNKWSRVAWKHCWGLFSAKGCFSNGKKKMQVHSQPHLHVLLKHYSLLAKHAVSWSVDDMLLVHECMRSKKVLALWQEHDSSAPHTSCMGALYALAKWF